jgi:hypothetical protein
MSTDEHEVIADLRERVAELERRLDEDDADTGTATRRGVLATAATVAGIGALGGRARAATPDGYLGSGSDPLGIYLADARKPDNGDPVQLPATLLKDEAADPSANGELQRNGSDVKVYSGGSVVNLTDVGGGALADSGTDTADGNGDLYELPQAEDGINLPNGPINGQRINNTEFHAETGSDIQSTLDEAQSNGGGTVTVTPGLRTISSTVDVWEECVLDLTNVILEPESKFDMIRPRGRDQRAHGVVRNGVLHTDPNRVTTGLSDFDGQNHIVLDGGDDWRVGREFAVLQQATPVVQGTSIAGGQRSDAATGGNAIGLICDSNLDYIWLQQFHFGSIYGTENAIHVESSAPSDATNGASVNGNLFFGQVYMPKRVINDNLGATSTNNIGGNMFMGLANSNPFLPTDEMFHYEGNNWMRWGFDFDAASASTYYVNFTATASNADHRGGTTNAAINWGGTANLVNGLGKESSNAETPQNNWPVGSWVNFTDSGDGSGDGHYLITSDKTAVGPL